MRNVRTISVKGYKVNFAVVENGELKQYSGDFDTVSPRRLTAKIAAAYGVDASKVVIIGHNEITATYRINDIIKAVDVLVNAGIAEKVTANETE